MLLGPIYVDLILPEGDRLSADWENYAGMRRKNKNRNL
jgi:hypothetical protein